MEFAALGAIGIVVVIALVVVVVVLLIVAGLIRGWYRVAKADEALVIVGKRQRGADGESSRITVITGGGAIVNPLTQRGDHRMILRRFDKGQACLPAHRAAQKDCQLLTFRDRQPPVVSA